MQYILPDEEKHVFMSVMVYMAGQRKVAASEVVRVMLMKNCFGERRLWLRIM